MKKRRRKLNANSSGQLLVVAALAIAMLISSTTMYVYEVSRETNSSYTYSISSFIPILKQSVKNAMISSLVNISNNGEKAVLTANLDKLSKFIRSITSFGIYQLDFAVLNDSAYDLGIQLSWNSSNMGISSAYADFSLKLYDMATNITVNYAVNITTTAMVNGFYTKLAGDEKLVNLTCKTYNEESPALAKNISLFYEDNGSWTPVNSSNNLSTVDYGNGTYTITFNIATSSENIQILAHVYDLREIFVQTSTTCYQT